MEQSEAQLLEEISRLKNAISRQTRPVSRGQSQPFRPPQLFKTHRAQPKEVIIGGVTFESSGKSLVRKTTSTVPANIESHTASTSVTPASLVPASAPVSKDMVRTKKGTLIAAHRIRKQHNPPNYNAVALARPTFHGAPTRGRGRLARPANMALHNVRRTRRQGHSVGIDKPCRHFTTRGACNNGLKCRFKHNADEVAICPRYLNDDCPNSAETCHLSHHSTPQRVPVCVHFANGGRCRNGTSCKYPHVKLGPKDGICRDFAVLGFCAKGLDCARQHVRECPDFESTGRCPTKGCKLPHVIRAKHKKVEGEQTAPTAPLSSPGIVTPLENDEFISLMFDESSEDEDVADEDDDADSEENDMQVDPSDGN